MQPALFLGTVKVGSGTDKYGSVIGVSPVVGVGLMAPKISTTFPTVPTVPHGVPVRVNFRQEKNID